LRRATNFAENLQRGKRGAIRIPYLTRHATKLGAKLRGGSKGVRKWNYLHSSLDETCNKIKLSKDLAGYVHILVGYI